MTTLETDRRIGIAVPLGGPAPTPLTSDETARYVRQLTMSTIGQQGQLRLKQARVLVVGAGGLGAPVITYLARAGVGVIGVVDDDTVATSNLHRQIIHDDSTVGLRKTASAVRAIRSANPHVRPVAHDERLTAATARDLIGRYDLVVDGTDDFTTRYAVADAVTELGIPCVWGTVLDTDGQLSVFWSTAPGGGVTLRDLYPVEPPASELTCATAGVLAPLCGVVASWMAAEAIKLIVGMGEPLLGRLLHVDGLDGTVAQARIRPEPGRRAPAPHAAPAPARPPETEGWLSVEDLRDQMRAGSAPVLIDVREDWEREIVGIPEAVPLPLAEISAAAVSALPAGPLVVHCHRDTRARQARALLAGHGRSDVLVLRGGVDAWAERIDPGLARY